MENKFVKITPEPLILQDIVDLVKDDSAGAITTFSGTTHKIVVQLDYEAYIPMAEKILLSMIDESRSKWNLIKVAIYHRVNTVPVGETSVIIAVSSAHRHESIHAVEWLIDQLKDKAPIWKKEIYNDGSKNILTSIIQYLENFKPNYVEFVSSLSKTITAMPIINILTVDLAELTKEIDDCLNVASELLSPQTSNMSESSLLVQNIADTIQNLCNDIKKEFQELTECNNLLRDLYDAEINESSLRIRKLNLLETANS
ncbi:4224_t:CDS:2 [Entrophospora sp. SA101]|nr:4224_t:CDS:2 [Entrophospora sp. SA101]